MPPTPIPANDLGLTHYWSGEVYGANGQMSLEDQLDKRGVVYESVPVPTLGTMAGTAYLVLYASVSTGRPVSALVIPHQWDVDAFGQDIYTFAGLDHDDARARDWHAEYDALRALTREV